MNPPQPSFGVARATPISVRWLNHRPVMAAGK
jgi:hypothetical protein